MTNLPVPDKATGPTLAELQAETLIEKHLRLLREKCPHEEIYSSTVLAPNGTFTNSHCLDCGKSWHTEHSPS